MLNVRLPQPKPSADAHWGTSGLLPVRASLYTYMRYPRYGNRPASIEKCDDGRLERLRNWRPHSRSSCTPHSKHYPTHVPVLHYVRWDMGVPGTTLNAPTESGSGARARNLRRSCPMFNRHRSPMPIKAMLSDFQQLLPTTYY